MFSSTLFPGGSLVGKGRSRVSAVGYQAILDQGLKSTFSAGDPLASSNRLLGRIKEGLLKAELSVSAYDTAWVAMVPSPRFHKTPCFPDCIDWIIDNQHSDGSWGPTHHKLSLIKDVLSSTLACILALSRWSVGEEYVKKGLSFFASNFSSSMNEELLSPVGFTIIFPGMISYAIEMGLDLPLRECDVDAMLYTREVELRRPWIGLDGTFLKKVGQNSGQGELLTAVGRDPNLEIYPVAYAFVEGENFDSWKWFLSCLADALRRPGLHGFTFMSDRQKHKNKTPGRPKGEIHRVDQKEKEDRELMNKLLSIRCQEIKKLQNAVNAVKLDTILGHAKMTMLHLHQRSYPKEGDQDLMLGEEYVRKPLHKESLTIKESIQGSLYIRVWM